jgi:alkylation response protein AidB-like acyl-CoA dehydrogenase
MLRHIRDVAMSTPDGSGDRLIDDAGFARRLTEAEMAVDGLEMTVFRVLSAAAQGGSPGDAASTVKILATTTHQQITELMVDAAGAYAQPHFSFWAGQNDPGGSPGRDMATYFAGRAQSIYGGTNEIQRTIIARKVLGL